MYEIEAQVHEAIVRYDCIREASSVDWETVGDPSSVYEVLGYAILFVYIRNHVSVSCKVQVVQTVYEKSHIRTAYDLNGRMH